jgi:hypothetical protein
MRFLQDSTCAAAAAATAAAAAARRDASASLHCQVSDKAKRVHALLAQLNLCAAAAAETAAAPNCQVCASTLH